MLDILRQNRSEPLLKINIDEGGGGEIVKKRFKTFDPSLKVNIDEGGGGGGGEIVKKRFKTFDPSLKMNIDEGGGGGGGEIVKKTLRALPQNEHWWGRGRRNRLKFSIFDPFYLLSYSAHVLFDFTAPFAKPPILGQRAWKSTALWNVSF